MSDDPNCRECGGKGFIVAQIFEDGDAVSLCPNCRGPGMDGPTNAHGWQDGNELTEKIAKLESQLAEARKDTERLDFISEPNHKVHFSWDCFKNPWTIFGLKHIPKGDTLREAIDAARASVEEGKP